VRFPLAGFGCAQKTESSVGRLVHGMISSPVWQAERATLSDYVNFASRRDDGCRPISGHDVTLGHYSLQIVVATMEEVKLGGRN
jgi:hypothetical protein